MKGHRACTPRAPSVHRRVAALCLAAWVAACGDSTDQLRDPGVPMGGTTRFEAVRFAGDWQAVACVGPCDAKVRYEAHGADEMIRQIGPARLTYQITAPGVMRTGKIDQTIVVMWVDDGFRTAAVGTADGGWAAIINRAGVAAGPDRIAAAREILDFNGWDIDRLSEVAR